MKVAVIDGIEQLSIREIEIPEVGPKDVLVKIYQNNICTTDWQTWSGLRASQERHFPWAFGHEMSGKIIELGGEVTSRLKVGMRVGLGSRGMVGCGECTYCRNGHPCRCMSKPKDPEYGGLSGFFGMSQYVVYPAFRVFPLSQDLPFEEGGYLEPVATSVHGIKRLRVVPGEFVLVIGAGNLGLVNAQVARDFGGKVLVSEIDEKRCELAKSLGFDVVNPIKSDFIEEIQKYTDGRGMDAVVLAVGNTKANDQSIQALSPMGRILFFAAGYPKPELNIDSNLIHYKEWELIGTFSADPSDFELAAKLLSDRRVKVDKLISYKIPLDDLERAFELAATPGNYRVSVSLW